MPLLGPLWVLKLRTCHMIVSGNDCWNSACFSCCRNVVHELADVYMTHDACTWQWSLMCSGKSFKGSNGKVVDRKKSDERTKSTLRHFGPQKPYVEDSGASQLDDFFADNQRAWRKRVLGLSGYIERLSDELFGSMDDDDVENILEDLEDIGDDLDKRDVTDHVYEWSHKFTRLPHVYLQMERESDVPLLRNTIASLHFGQYSFSIPLRLKGWVGLDGWLHTCTKATYPQPVTQPSTKKMFKRVELFSRGKVTTENRFVLIT